MNFHDHISKITLDCGFSPESFLFIPTLKRYIPIHILWQQLVNFIFMKPLHSLRVLKLMSYTELDALEIALEIVSFRFIFV